jgi:hypothetical protein
LEAGARRTPKRAKTRAAASSAPRAPSAAVAVPRGSRGDGALPRRGGPTAPDVGTVVGALGSSSQWVSANTCCPSTLPRRAVRSSSCARLSSSSPPKVPKKLAKYM